VDTIFSRSLIAAVLAVVLFLGSPSARASINASYDAAQSACINQGIPGVLSTHPDATGATCVVLTNDQGDYFGVQSTYNGRLQGDGYYPFTGVPPPPPGDDCGSVWPTNTHSEAGKITAGSSSCGQAVFPDGSIGYCKVNMSPAAGAVPTFDGNKGTWTTEVTETTVGSCDAATPPVTAAGKPIPGAAQPQQIPPPEISPPDVCGTGSCYDPNKGYCASSADGQVCVPSSQGQSPRGGCITSGSTTVCAGNPTAPTPSPAVVPSPPSQIQSADGYQQADPVTGAPLYVQVPVYSTGGSTSSGAQSGDSTPAGSSSSSGPSSSGSSGKSGTYGGGIDCKTPPACTGDSVECGAATTQWATTCELHTDLTGPTGAAPTDYGTLSTQYAQGDVWTSPSTGNTSGDSANSGHYDSSGFGYGTTCPATDVSVDFMGSTVSAPLSIVCPFGVWIRALVIGFATFSAVMITWGGRAG
jgi:hypothetical protein